MARPRALSLAAAGAVALLVSCSEPDPRPTFHAADDPPRLSDWGALEVHDGVLELAPRAHPYDLATPLFSDYAQKLRTISLPADATATYAPEGNFDLPVGTILTKTFYYPRDGEAVGYGEERTAADGVMPLGGLQLIETRILARREAGWIALAYVWNEDQSDAFLRREGALIPLVLRRPDGRKEPFTYLVPNANQCAGCHGVGASRAVEPIGVKARHLNKASSFAAGVNQLDHWRLAGLLDGDFSEAAAAPANVSWTDASVSLEARARAYLDVNCAHCHSDAGPADTSGLDLSADAPMGPKFGLCKGTIAAGAGSGGRPYDITPGDPEKSITVFRMQTNDPAAMMPELGRAVTHEEGVALIREWIGAMSGRCS